jgi:hypothetical protein
VLSEKKGKICEERKEHMQGERIGKKADIHLCLLQWPRQVSVPLCQPERRAALSQDHDVVVDCLPLPVSRLNN